MINGTEFGNRFKTRIFDCSLFIFLKLFVYHLSERIFRKESAGKGKPFTFWFFPIK